MNIANFLSCLRLFFLPFFLIALFYYSPDREYLRYLAIALALLSFLSDGLDGYLARKKGLETNLGSFLDPLGDKLLINSGFIVLILKPEFRVNLNLPIWVAGVIIFRDVFLALGSFILHLRNKLKIAPSYLGKSAVVLQMISILGALFYFRFTSYIWYFAGFITILAGLGYIWREGFKFLN